VTVPAEPAPAPVRNIAGNSSAVAAWTIVSRITGFLRIILIAAVLGPTYLGNLFLAINSLPNLALQFLGGSLVGSLLIPALVGSIDRGDREETERVAGGFLGAALAALGAAGLLAVAAAPLILGLLSIGVEDRAAAADQQRLGWILMALTMPQLALYGAAIIGGAVMNAHGRFALAAAAPVAENVGVMVTMVVVAIWFGTGTSLSAVSTAELLVLGVGSTLAVAAHAGVMVWGARRTGTRLAPSRGWRIEPVRRLLRRMTASLGQTSLNALRVFAMLAVANTVPAGVVALQFALNFLWLPVQVGGRPIALTLLPELSRLDGAGRRQAFRDEYARGGALIAFFTLPAAAAYLALSGSLGEAVSFGEMTGSAGPSLVAACVAGLAVAVVGESAFQLATYASYAREDARSPLRASVVGTIVSLLCLPIALSLHDDDAVLLAVGLSFSLGSAVAAIGLHRRLRRLLPESRYESTRSLLKTLAASLVMLLPASAACSVISGALSEPAGVIVGLAVAAVLGVATFVGLQALLRSPELAYFLTGLRRTSTGGP
jgi:putative peptidoglycan lipid II flippase